MKRVLILLLAVMIASGLISGVALAKADKTTPESTSKAVSNDKIQQDLKNGKASDAASKNPMPWDNLPIPGEDHSGAKGEGKIRSMPEPSGKASGDSADKLAPGTESTSSSQSATASASPSPYSSYTIDYINNGSPMTIAQLQLLANGNQHNNNAYIAQYWQNPTTIRVFASYADWQASPTHGWPVLFETLAQSQAICGPNSGGCHSVSGGVPIAYVGWQDNGFDGTSWVAGHELSEMEENPFINRVQKITNAVGGGVFKTYYYFFESIDPVQNYSAGYRDLTTNTYQTDWTTPNYWANGPAPHNFRNTAPALAPDCHWSPYAAIQYYSIDPDTSGTATYLHC